MPRSVQFVNLRDPIAVCALPESVCEVNRLNTPFVQFLALMLPIDNLGKRPKLAQNSAHSVAPPVPSASILPMLMSGPDFRLTLPKLTANCPPRDLIEPI